MRSSLLLALAVLASPAAADQAPTFRTLWKLAEGLPDIPEELASEEMWNGVYDERTAARARGLLAAHEAWEAQLEELIPVTPQALQVDLGAQRTLYRIDLRQPARRRLVPRGTDRASLETRLTLLSWLRYQDGDLTRAIDHTLRRLRLGADLAASTRNAGTFGRAQATQVAALEALGCQLLHPDVPVAVIPRAGQLLQLLSPRLATRDTVASFVDSAYRHAATRVRAATQARKLPSGVRDRILEYLAGSRQVVRGGLASTDGRAAAREHELYLMKNIGRLPRSPAVQRLLPDFLRSLTLHLHVDAFLVLDFAAVRLATTYRLQKAWPASLEPILPHPADPFSGLPLAYRLVDGRPWLACAGRDKAVHPDLLERFRLRAPSLTDHVAQAHRKLGTPRPSDPAPEPEPDLDALVAARKANPALTCTRDRESLVRKIEMYRELEGLPADAPLEPGEELWDAMEAGPLEVNFMRALAVCPQGGSFSWSGDRKSLICSLHGKPVE